MKNILFKFDSVNHQVLVGWTSFDTHDICIMMLLIIFLSVVECTCGKLILCTSVSLKWTLKPISDAVSNCSVKLLCNLYLYAVLLLNSTGT